MVEVSKYNKEALIPALQAVDSKSRLLALYGERMLGVLSDWHHESTRGPTWEQSHELLNWLSAFSARPENPADHDVDTNTRNVLRGVLGVSEVDPVDLQISTQHGLFITRLFGVSTQGMRGMASTVGQLSINSFDTGELAVVTDDTIETYTRLQRGVAAIRRSLFHEVWDI